MTIGLGEISIDTIHTRIPCCAIPYGEFFENFTSSVCYWYLGWFFPRTTHAETIYCVRTYGVT